MIVYNVNRRWFTEQAKAESYRRSLGLKPGATIKLAVNGRDDLAALLNGLCEPVLMPAVQLHEQDRRDLADRAYVDPNVEVPDFVPLFLIKDTEQRARVKTDREARGWNGEE